MFPQAYCTTIVQTSESSVSTFNDDPDVYDANQSARNLQPEAEVR